MSEAHAQDPVAGLEHGEVGGHVRLSAGVGLDVDVLGAREQRQGALLCQPLHHVHVLAAAVVALPGQALRVLVGEPRALRLEHRRERVVLAGDELDLPVLPVALGDHRRPQLGVGLARLPRSAGFAGSTVMRRSPGVRCCSGSVPAVLVAARPTDHREPPASPGRGPPASERRPARRCCARRSRAVPLHRAPGGSLDVLPAQGALSEDSRSPSAATATTLEGTPACTCPSSMTSASDSPTAATSSAAVRASGSPERLAEVTASGPRHRASLRGTGVVRQADAVAGASTGQQAWQADLPRGPAAPG